jgi:hypothetical protein
MQGTEIIISAWTQTGKKRASWSGAPLVHNLKEDIFANSIQLIAGRGGRREYNSR